ncbi:hypothetical protein EKH83_09465 [Arcticibacter tournemirensis]|uniref:Pentapeptide repeat-containing protein n=1 Tax=Arcticibacter tournemirensis TaxID=699437 RepID=A0A4Q0MBK7_9SPHI|nr:hypothetical protein EKH83_09465 [Arcticibacter tournemirensis]
MRPSWNLQGNAGLSGLRFSDFQLRDCNLTLCGAENTAFQNELFVDFKLEGIDFSITVLHEAVANVAQREKV